MLTSAMLVTLRQLAPLVDLRGITVAQWARDAGTSELTLRRYLRRSTHVGDAAALERLLAGAECFVVVASDTLADALGGAGAQVAGAESG